MYNIPFRLIFISTCSIYGFQLQLHIVNEKMGDMHHGNVSFTKSVPANEYDFYFNIN